MDLTSPKIAALARYWEEKRGARPMPPWSDIDPAEIKPLLPHLLVSRYEHNPFRVRYTLVGTWLARYAGGDFTDRYLDELDFSNEDTDWPEHHRRFIAEARPCFGICRFVTASGVERDYESAMFPIAGPDGRTVERALGIEDFPAGTDVGRDPEIVASAPQRRRPPRDADPLHLIAEDLQPVPPTDAEFRRRLGEAKLATDDLAGPGKHYFRLVELGTCRGYGGFELHGRSALLRSVVIDGASRGRGYGHTLVRRLLDEIRGRGADAVYLLTETAAPFFATLGFMPCDRDRAPAEIAGTRQFEELCPAGARLMRLDLGER
jgi:GNAT superfamily N-acetyltransferase